MSTRGKQLVNQTPGWIIILTDIVALLLTFFVMLFFMSSVTPEKWTELISAFSTTVTPTIQDPSTKPSAEFNISTVMRKSAINLDYLLAVLDDKTKRDKIISSKWIYRLLSLKNFRTST